MNDPVNPKHYKRGPIIDGRQTEAIEVIRHIRDARLANALKYIWRVGFGGKENNRADISKAVWYLQDWLDHPIDEPAPTRRTEGERGRDAQQ